MATCPCDRDIASPVPQVWTLHRAEKWQGPHSQDAESVFSGTAALGSSEKVFS